MRVLIHTHCVLNTYRFHTDYQRQKKTFIFINIFKTFFKVFLYHTIQIGLSSFISVAYSICTNSFLYIMLTVLLVHMYSKRNSVDVCGCYLITTIYIYRHGILLEKFCRESTTLHLGIS